MSRAFVVDELFCKKTGLQEVNVTFITYLPSQWPTFKLFGITYLVGKVMFTLLFHGPLAE